jgi:adenosylcobinamide-phosphate synthase
MLVLGAFIVDLLVGDPRWLLHPVVVIGTAISWLESILRQRLAPLLGLRMSGVLLTVLIVTTTYWATYGLVEGAGKLHWLLGIMLALWLLSTAIATTSLYKSAQEIYALLLTGNLAQARVKVGWIVGRDTQALDEAEIVRATIETVAENIVDGIISPLVYGLLGGAPLAMAYRAVNTLDSMVGYKNDKYREFGWASARLDDVANFIPARITAVLLLLVAALSGYNWRMGWQILRRDAPKHPSPNSGYPEATMAGILGIRLGGLNYYGGQQSFRAYMGEKLRPLEVEDIRRAWRLMYGAAIAAAVLGGSLGWSLFGI